MDCRRRRAAKLQRDGHQSVRCGAHDMAAHAGCAGELIQELGQLLEIVVEVLALLKVAVELLDLLLLLILQVLLALGLLLLLLDVLVVLRLKLKHAAFSIDLLFKV